MYQLRHKRTIYERHYSMHRGLIAGGRAEYGRLQVG
jgi:hypothetical protein